jgi:hypothetical protein
MKSESFQVVTHDGYKGNERPSAVIAAGVRLEVALVERSWVSSGVHPTSEVAYGFEVTCLGGDRFRLVYTDARGWRVARL